MLDAAKRRYPSSEIVFAGPRKNYELFEADPRISHREIAYARGGSLRDRLEATAALWFDVDNKDGLVLDPDSRLTQLGLIRVCPDDGYRLFESRSFGGDANERLPDLAAALVRASRFPRSHHSTAASTIRPASHMAMTWPCVRISSRALSP